MKRTIKNCFLQTIELILHELRFCASRSKRLIDKLKLMARGACVNPSKYSPTELLQTYQQSKNLFTNNDPSINDLISIIIPCHNSEKYIAKAIDSCLQQRGVAIEILVVDDGSTDSTARIANDLANRNNSIRLLRMPKNFGCYYARNWGIMNANGRYIAFLDSDDIMHPDRLYIQVLAIKSSPSCMASISLTSKWSSNFSKRLLPTKYSENSLVVERDVFRLLGFYDSVRYAGDSEFRERLIAAKGKHAIARVPIELYYLRDSPDSLTSKDSTLGSQAYTISNGRYMQKLSDERRMYVKNFRLWHKENKFNCSNKGSLFIDFPLRVRPFSLGSTKQNASLSIGEKVYGYMASFPNRESCLRVALPSILSQVDHLTIYLNIYKSIPDFLRDERITVHLGKMHESDIRDNGKFYDMQTSQQGYIFTFDDDILYPDDYCARLIHYIESLSRRAVVGCHGITLPLGSFYHISQRIVYNFREACSGGFVDMLGTGTTAWHSTLFIPRLNEFRTTGLSDVWFAKICMDKEIPMYCIPRNSQWMKQLQNNSRSLWEETRKSSSNYFSVIENDLRPSWRSGATRINATKAYKFLHNLEN